MKWVELKMEQLGVLSNPDFKITALMDHLAMITVQSENQSRKKTFDCKPLGVIWAQFPEVSTLFLCSYYQFNVDLC
jgi:ubiquitin-like domain-containing CTD phosphatase 1